MKKGIIVLLAIFTIGTFFRFWQLSETPPSLSHDEVAIGYNAYSLLKTGKDEYGTSLPLLFRSFDDYKLGGMVYTTIPSIAIFGLNEWGVRFPSAFFGILAVVVFYFLVKQLVENDKNIPLFATFFFAVSIWHINFSRQLFESNGALFFLLLGTCLLLKFPQRPILLLVVAPLYGLSLYFYYSPRLIIPFLILTFLIVYRKEILKNIKVVFLAFMIGLVTILPLLSPMISPSGLARIGMVSVANDQNYLARKERFTAIIAQNNNFLNRIIYNRRVALVLTIGENYLKNLSPRHVFFKGTGSAGLLYPLEIPFFLAGFYFLLRLRGGAKWIVLAWLLSTPLVGGLSTDQPNALRTLPNAPFFAFLSGLGLGRTFEFFKKGKLKVVFIILFGIFFLFFSVKFLRAYFQDYPQTHSLHFGDGYKQMVNFLINHEERYDQIYISGYYWRPYIFILFWKAYDPALYQEGGTKAHFGKYYFGKANWDSEGVFFGDPRVNIADYVQNQKRILFILAPQEFAVHKEKLREIAVIDGKFATNIFIAAIPR